LEGNKKGRKAGKLSETKTKKRGKNKRKEGKEGKEGKGRKERKQEPNLGKRRQKRRGSKGNLTVLDFEMGGCRFRNSDFQVRVVVFDLGNDVEEEFSSRNSSEINHLLGA